MIQVYVPMQENRRISIPLVAYEELGVGAGGWLRLSVVEFGRALLERVPPEMPQAHHSRRGSDRGGPAGRARSHGTAAMMQVFVAVGKAAHIDLPTGVSRALGVKHGDWLRITVSEDRVALVEPVGVETPDPLPLPDHSQVWPASEHEGPA